MTPQQSKTNDTRDIIIQVRENFEYFQDSVIADLQELDTKIEDQQSKHEKDMCGLSNRIAEIEKDVIRKQGQSDGQNKDISSLQKDIEAIRKSNADHKTEVADKVRELKEQYRKDLSIAITVVSIVVGLLTYIITRLWG